GRVEHRVFVACGGGIALSALLALFTAIRPSAGRTVPLLLFAESLTFLCFGLAWFVKGAARKHPRPAGDTQDEPAGGSVPATTGQSSSRGATLSAARGGRGAGAPRPRGQARHWAQRAWCVAPGGSSGGGRPGPGTAEAARVREFGRATVGRR